MQEKESTAPWVECYHDGELIGAAPCGKLSSLDSGFAAQACAVCGGPFGATLYGEADASVHGFEMLHAPQCPNANPTKVKNK